MFKQIITPETKEDLIVRLPDKFIGKEIEVEVNEVKKDYKSERQSANKSVPDSKKKREKALKKAFEFFRTISVDMSKFKFNREEANAR